MSIDVDALPVLKKFNRRMVGKDTWIINPFNPVIGTPRPYVIIGEEYAALFDPTDTTLPLRDFIEQAVTDKPLKVFCTHSHLDHTNDNYMFEDCDIYMSEYAWGEIQNRRTMDNAKGMWVLTSAEKTKVEMTPEQRGTYTPKLLKVGDKVDLGGGHVIEVLPYVGCHSPGSLVYLDHGTGILFTGDEIEGGQMLVMGQPGTKSCVEQLHENVVCLIEGWGSEIKAICPPHNGSPLVPEFLGYLKENCERVLNGIDGSMDIRGVPWACDPTSMGGRTVAMMEDPDILRSEWMGTSIVYNRKRLHKSDIL